MTDCEYLNDSKCKNMIEWSPKLKLILSKHSEVQVFYCVVFILVKCHDVSAKSPKFIKLPKVFDSPARRLISVIIIGDNPF